MNDTVGAGYVRFRDFRSVYGGMFTMKLVIQLLAKGAERRDVGDTKATSIAG